MKFAIRQTAVLCALVLMGAPSIAQVTPKRAETPSRQGAPGRGVGVAQPLTPEAMSPILSQAATVSRSQPRAFNLDTALARILADLKITGASGEFELSVTNNGKAEITIFPLSIHLLDGQVRTELDISAAPSRVDSKGPFSVFRQVGLTRVVNLTQASGSLRLTSMMFPEAKAYVTRELPAEDMPLLIRLEKKPLGQEALNGLACEKSIVTLVYPTGEKRDARLWQTGGTPRQVVFEVGETLLTIRLREAQGVSELRAQDAALRKVALFETPKDYTKYSEVEQIIANVSARQFPSRR